MAIAIGRRDEEVVMVSTDQQLRPGAYGVVVGGVGFETGELDLVFGGPLVAFRAGGEQEGEEP